MELLVAKTRMTREGCRVTTVIRKGPKGDMQEEIILQAENLVEAPLELDFEEEDTGRWLTGRM